MGPCSAIACINLEIFVKYLAALGLLAPTIKTTEVRKKHFLEIIITSISLHLLNKTVKNFSRVVKGFSSRGCREWGGPVGEYVRCSAYQDWLYAHVL